MSSSAESNWDTNAKCCRVSHDDGPGSDLKKILEYHQETIIKFPVRGRLFGGVPVYSDSLCNP